MPALVLLVIGLPVIAILGWQVAAMRRLRRLGALAMSDLHAIPRTPIGRVREGQRVRVLGIARGEARARAPYSGTECLAFRAALTVTVEAAGGYVTTTHGPVLEDVHAFAVADDSGEIAVLAAHSRLALAPRRVPIEIVRRHVVGAGTLAREAAPTYDEGIISPGDRVAVIATVVRGQDGTLQLGGSPDAPAMISTVPAALEA